MNTLIVLIVYQKSQKIIVIICGLFKTYISIETKQESCYFFEKKDDDYKFTNDSIFSFKFMKLISEKKIAWR